MAKELATKYDPSEFEDKIYDFWQENKYFHAEPDETKTPYTIVIPPPNITGQLHMGHALDNTLQDILIRYHRMKGFDTLWVPGTDHASIATEAKIVEAMKQEGITKDDIGREAFLERAWDWRRQYGGRIVEQLKKLGSSCDWDRERFTMDEGCSKAVVEVFNRLYEKGLIYRGERLINWCPHCMTSISDAEVEYEEKDGAFWHLRYPFADGSGYLELATTRPETMFGDTAVAVNPEDPRYKDKIGQMLILPLVGKEIPLIGDEHADPEFGTGVVKITPAHDPNDYEVGLRHDLPIINVMTDDGRMNENVPEKYVGMTTEECRKACVADLEEQGYLVRVEPMKHNVGTCYRCGTVVEPRISKQWFVKMKPLADPAIDIVRSGKVQFVPSRYDKTYFHWMENIKDWCISRQLWWGHRIPAWYCDDCGEITVSRGTPCKCEYCGSEHIRQDEDTLDTWFSSALWPFSTLGWPDETPELKHYFPTNTLVTGYDIIFFWVARMIFSSVEQMGTYPFDTIFIHGIVRDELGRKMSKSLGNGIDPLVVIDKYGADALRFTLVTGNSPGNDMRYSEKKVEASRNFGNKIWNAARYILMNLDGSEGPAKLPAAEDLAIEDKWILSKFNTLCKEVSENIDSYELGVALAKLYDFIWDLFCDWYIEISKIRLQEGGKGAETAKAVLIYCMDGMLKLLHPFMPFLTEEIWQSLPHEGDTIMLAPYPEYTGALDFSAEETEFERIMTAVRAIRARRSEMNVPPSKKSAVHFDTPFEDTFRSGVVYIQRLASATEVTVGGDFDTEGAVNIVTADAQIYLPMNELVDLDAEKERLTKELEKAQKDLAFFEKKLNNPGFVNNAPAAVVEKDRASAEKIKDKINLLEESLKNLA
ncbi:MAG: valine--tRNA ligase [Acutalibacteraceae bacterium]|nr:valine--tRNA ligase [Clostridia bacterium]MEE3311184.1 valine--tRNA ligase [Acutalibacteraceae bacterium]